MIGHPAQPLLELQMVKRRRGRPHLSWVSEVRKHVECLDSSIINNEKQWRKAISQYCFS